MTNAHALLFVGIQTEAVKPVLGNYYREPEPSPGPIPFHLWPTLVKSFKEDQYVEATGDVVFYKNE